MWLGGHLAKANPTTTHNCSAICSASHGILPVNIRIKLFFPPQNLWFLTIPEYLFCPCDFEIGSLGEQISCEVSIFAGCFPG